MIADAPPRRHPFPPLPIYRLPILWLFLGPPIFRTGVNDALESMNMGFDPWNLVRAIWYLLFGYVALAELYRLRRHVRPFLRRLGLFPWLVGLWLAAAFASAASSPSPVFTVANAGFMTIIVVAALDFGLKLHLGLLRPARALQLLLGFALAMLGVFVAALVLVPNLVSDGFPAVLRARGGHVADNGLMSQVVFMIGVFLASKSQGATRHAYVLLVLLSPAFLVIAQTRAMYVTFIAGGGVLLAQWLSHARRRTRLEILGMLALAGSGLFAIGLHADLTGSGQAARLFETYVIRDRDSLAGWNSRGALAAILLDRLASQPWGLGYSAGPRLVLLTAPYEELLRHGIYERFAGNAHNMYIEVIAGAGIVGGIVFVGFLAWLLIHAWRFRHDIPAPALALFLIVIVGGLTESDAVLPFHQVAVLLWITAAFVAAVPRRPRPASRGAAALEEAEQA